MNQYMRTIALAPLFLFAVSARGGDAPAEPGRPLAIVGVRVFTGDSSLRVLENATVIVRGGKIDAVGPAAQVLPPVDCTILDGSGRTLLPGLFDLHVHLGGSGTRFDRPVRGDMVLRAEQTVACGVTSVLDLNAPETQIFELRAAARSGALGGLPRIFAAGAAITAPRGHGSELGFPCRVLVSGSQVHEEIADLAGLRPDVVKIMYDHGGWAELPRAPSLDPDLLRGLIEEAHERGLKVVVHVVELEHAKTALRAGADVLGHYPLQGGVDEELLRLLTRSGAAVIPTLAAFEASFVPAKDSRFLDNLLVSQFVDPRVVEGFRDPAWRAQSALSLHSRSVEQSYAEALVGVKTLFERGVRLLVGTDAGNPGTFHGVSVHRELAALVRAGIAPERVLAMATRDAARFLGLGKELGSVRPGFAADLLLVEGNPLRRIEDSGKVVAVIRDGRQIRRDVIAGATRALAGEAPAQPLGGEEPSPRILPLHDFERMRGSLPRESLLSDRSGNGSSSSEARCMLDDGPLNRTRFLRVGGEVVFRPPTGGFAGVLLSTDPAHADFSSFTGIRFRARSGEDGSFRVRLRTRGVRDFDEFGASFRAGKEWSAYKIPFSQLRQIGFGKRVRLDLGEVREIEVVTDTGTEGPFHLDLDDIQLFR
ncbi:MAG: CIA30 family protein [Planctomycetota bacterium]